MRQIIKKLKICEIYGSFIHLDYSLHAALFTKLNEEELLLVKDKKI